VANLCYLLTVFYLFRLPGRFKHRVSLPHSDRAVAECRPLAGLALIIIVTAYTASAFGILLASMVKTQRQLSAVGILAVLLMSAPGSSRWPLDIMSSQ
jgi:hypothetical protein